MMNNTEIKLNKEQFSILVTNIENATDNLNQEYEEIELSGNMPSMEAVISTFCEISQCISKCNTMYIKLVKNLNEAATALTEQDRILAEVK